MDSPKNRDKNDGTFIIYMGSRRAIYNDIAASTSVFFRPRQKNSLGQCRALGPIPSGSAVPSAGLRPWGTALPPGIFYPRTKKNLGFGAALLCIALRDPIYTLHIYI